MDRTLEQGELQAVVCLMCAIVRGLSIGLQRQAWAEFDTGITSTRAFLVEHGYDENALRGFDRMVEGIRRMR